MEFRTVVKIANPGFVIEPLEPVLFVGSCFADSIGRRFEEEHFPVCINPFGVMYNPVSVLHTVQRVDVVPRLVFITLGTNHVYRLKETGEVVDNCQKRPQRLFQEEVLSMEQCVQTLTKVVDVLTAKNPDVHVVLTVSPIRYAKYGFHESQLSKATLLLAIDQLLMSLNAQRPDTHCHYFPAYEIVIDELRDYRFYQEDMLHPSAQAVEYIWQRLCECYLSEEAREFIEAWRPLKAALSHRPFHPDSEEYKAFMDKTMLKVAELQKKYPTFAL